MIAIAKRMKEKCNARKLSRGVGARSENSADTDRKSRKRGKSRSTRDMVVNL